MGDHCQTMLPTHTIHIDGMSCSHCLNAVNRAVQSVPDVRLTSVAVGRATVQCDPTQLPMVRHAIEKAGYRAHVPPETPS